MARYFIQRSRSALGRPIANMWEVYDNDTSNVFNARRVVTPPMTYDEAERWAAYFNADLHLVA